MITSGGAASSGEPSVTTAVTGDEVAEHIAKELGAESLEDACQNDDIGWACNVVEIEPLTPTDMRVVITEPAKSVLPVGVAMGFKNFTVTGEGSPLPDLKTVIVVNSAGDELYRVTE
ncbi:hypothetical protein [Microbacterium sp. BK668]|uniref:hypothetical protein n=1 Tax=Microbacterium sp. BK668 TaxID=2512118 RepID=UPI00105C705B|nr:hypothetical protein [Microbacterium sp. BK668]TDN87723.1 hypothetical protein EV279_3150 [Microbacterium sp. BK668]